MDRTERFYKIDRMLNDRRVVPIGDFLNALEVSLATFKRDLEYMRDRFNAPIVWDRALRGYRFEEYDSQNTSYALPGLWFNESEIYALLSMQQLLKGVQPGLLEPHITPLLSRILGLLEGRDNMSGEVQKRIKVIQMASRSAPTQYFEQVSTALLSRRCLKVVHYNRQRDEEIERVVSPQRLVHYRDNWYLDGWCHLRKALRSFSLDGFRKIEMIEAPANDIQAQILDAELGSGYGIFGGSKISTACLRFSPQRAKWVSNEHWHPQQLGEFDKEGYYLMQIPFGDPRELLMDILRHGSDVEVVEPEELRAMIREAVRSMSAIYRK